MMDSIDSIEALSDEEEVPEPAPAEPETPENQSKKLDDALSASLEGFVTVLAEIHREEQAESRKGSVLEKHEHMISVRDSPESPAPECNLPARKAGSSTVVSPASEMDTPHPKADSLSAPPMENSSSVGKMDKQASSDLTVTVEADANDLSHAGQSKPDNPDANSLCTINGSVLDSIIQDNQETNNCGGDDADKDNDRKNIDNDVDVSVINKSEIRSTQEHNEEGADVQHDEAANDRESVENHVVGAGNESESANNVHIEDDRVENDQEAMNTADSENNNTGDELNRAATQEEHRDDGPVDVPEHDRTGPEPGQQPGSGPTLACSDMDQEGAEPDHQDTASGSQAPATKEQGGLTQENDPDQVEDGSQAEKVPAALESQGATNGSESGKDDEVDEPDSMEDGKSQNEISEPQNEPIDSTVDQVSEAVNLANEDGATAVRNDGPVSDTGGDAGVAVLDDEPISDTGGDAGVAVLDNKPASDTGGDAGVAAPDDGPASDTGSDAGVDMPDEAPASNTGADASELKGDETTFDDDKKKHHDDKEQHSMIKSDEEGGEAISDGNCEGRDREQGLDKEPVTGRETVLDTEPVLNTEAVLDTEPVSSGDKKGVTYETDGCEDQLSDLESKLTQRKRNCSGGDSFENKRIRFGRDREILTYTEQGSVFHYTFPGGHKIRTTESLHTCDCYVKIEDFEVTQEEFEREVAHHIGKRNNQRRKTTLSDDPGKAVVKGRHGGRSKIDEDVSHAGEDRSKIDEDVSHAGEDQDESAHGEEACEEESRGSRRRTKPRTVIVGIPKNEDEPHHQQGSRRKVSASDEGVGMSSTEDIPTPSSEATAKSIKGTRQSGRRTLQGIRDADEVEIKEHEKDCRRSGRKKMSSEEGSSKQMENVEEYEDDQWNRKGQRRSNGSNTSQVQGDRRGREAEQVRRNTPSRISRPSAARRRTRVCHKRDDLEEPVCDEEQEEDAAKDEKDEGGHRTSRSGGRRGRADKDHNQHEEPVITRNGNITGSDLSNRRSRGQAKRRNVLDSEARTHRLECHILLQRLTVSDYQKYCSVEEFDDWIHRGKVKAENMAGAPFSSSASMSLTDGHVRRNTGRNKHDQGPSCPTRTQTRRSCNVQIPGKERNARAFRRSGRKTGSSDVRNRRNCHLSDDPGDPSGAGNQAGSDVEPDMDVDLDIKDITSMLTTQLGHSESEAASDILDDMKVPEPQLDNMPSFESSLWSAGMTGQEKSHSDSEDSLDALFGSEDAHGLSVDGDRSSKKAAAAHNYISTDHDLFDANCKKRNGVFLYTGPGGEQVRSPTAVQKCRVRLQRLSADNHQISVGGGRTQTICGQKARSTLGRRSVRQVMQAVKPENEQAPLSRYKRCSDEYTEAKPGCSMAVHEPTDGEATRTNCHLESGSRGRRGGKQARRRKGSREDSADCVRDEEAQDGSDGDHGESVRRTRRSGRQVPGALPANPGTRRNPRRGSTTLQYGSKHDESDISDDEILSERRQRVRRINHGSKKQTLHSESENTAQDTMKHQGSLFYKDTNNKHKYDGSESDNDSTADSETQQPGSTEQSDAFSRSNKQGRKQLRHSDSDGDTNNTQSQERLGILAKKTNGADQDKPFDSTGIRSDDEDSLDALFKSDYTNAYTVDVDTPGELSEQECDRSVSPCAGSGKSPERQTVGKPRKCSSGRHVKLKEGSARSLKSGQLTISDEYKCVVKLRRISVDPGQVSDVDSPAPTRLEESSNSCTTFVRSNLLRRSSPVHESSPVRETLPVNKTSLTTKLAVKDLVPEDEDDSDLPVCDWLSSSSCQ